MCKGENYLPNTTPVDQLEEMMAVALHPLLPADFVQSSNIIDDKECDDMQAVQEIAPICCSNMPAVLHDFL